MFFIRHSYPSSLCDKDIQKSSLIFIEGCFTSPQKCHDWFHVMPALLFSEQSCDLTLLSPLQDLIAYSKFPSLFLYGFCNGSSQSCSAMLIQIETLKKNG